MIRKILLAGLAALSLNAFAYDPSDMMIYNQYNDPTDLHVMTRTIEGMTHATCSDGPCSVTSISGAFIVCDSRPTCYEFEHGDTSGSIFDTRTGITTTTDGNTTQGEPTMSEYPPSSPDAP